MNTIRERFEQIIKNLYNGNKRAFATSIGISPTVIENVVGSRNGKPSYEVLVRICANANISAQWLLTGKGEMLNQPTETSDGVKILETNIVRASDTIEEDTRPRIPFEAAAGALSIAIDSVALSDCERYPVIPSFPKYDFTIIVRGDSMIPDFQSGDELACSFIRDSKFIQWGRPHVLDTAQGIVVKRIFDSNADYLTCRSVNPDYPDISVPKDEIYHIALVVGLIRHF